MKKLIDGVYVDLTPKEIEVVSLEETALLPVKVRSQRNSLLAQSDVYALADRMTPAWATYRQALRDITAQLGFPHCVEWPVKPE